MGQKLMNTPALDRFSFERPASALAFNHTLDRTVDEIRLKNNIPVFLDTHIYTCTAVAKRHLPAIQR